MVFFPFDVFLLVLIGAQNILTRHGFHQALCLLLEVIAIAVKQMKQRIDGIKVCTQARVKVTYIFCLDIRL